MGPQRARQLRERLQPAVGRPPEPLAQVRLGPGGAPILPEPAEILFEQVPLDDGTIEPQQRGQAGPVLSWSRSPSACHA